MQRCWQPGHTNLEVDVQGVYYYFYQNFKNEAEARALRAKKLGKGDGTVGMFTSLFIAALAGYA